VLHGFIRLPYSVHRSAYGWIPIPVACIKNGDGPRVLLMAGNHGAEYEGQVALGKLIRSLEAEEVCGRIIILPSANFPAAMAGMRTSPLDEGNLNPAFRATPMATRRRRSPTTLRVCCCRSAISCSIFTRRQLAHLCAQRADAPPTNA
jgi:predicted deacylase